MALPEGFDDVAYDAPNHEIVAGVDPNRLVVRIGRQKPGAVPFHLHALDREFPVHIADGNAVVVGFDGFVDDKQVAVVDAVARHAVARHTHEECRGWIVHQLAVQVERRIDKIVRRRRKPSLDLASGDGKFLAGRCIGTMKSYIVFSFIHVIRTSPEIDYYVFFC